MRAIAAGIVGLSVGQLARAGSEAVPTGAGLLSLAFLAFIALIVVFQLIPALTLFAAMVWGFFAPDRGGRGAPSVDAAGNR